MKIDVEKLAREATAYMQEWCTKNWYTDGEPEQVRNEHFARLVMEECAKVCDTTPPEPFRPSIEAAHAIRSMMP